MLLNKYEAVSDKELTQEEKENSCWSKGSFSGSQVKKIILNPIEVYTHWDNNSRETFNEAAKKRMQNGQDWEEHCIQIFEKKYRRENPNERNFKIHVDKRTFKSLSNENCYANIDGFLSDTGKIEDAYCGIEIKTTSIDVPKSGIEAALFNYVDENYAWQIRYYMWFFNVPKWVVVIFKDWTPYAFAFKYEEEIEYIQHMLTVIDEMRLCWNTKVVPYWSQLPPAKDIPVEEIELNSELYNVYNNTIERYIELSSYEKVGEAEKKQLKESILNAFIDTSLLSYNDLKQYKFVKDGVPKLTISYLKKRDSYLPIEKILEIINKNHNAKYTVSDFLDESEGSDYTPTIRILKGAK